MYFYEAAAFNLACVTSGYGGVQTAIPAQGIMDDGITPMEGLFNVELAYAATGMKAEQANELVKQLLEKYPIDWIAGEKATPNFYRRKVLGFLVASDGWHENDVAKMLELVEDAKAASAAQIKFYDKYSNIQR